MSWLADAFLAQAGAHPEGVWSAPGRVNLIGEHTDYSGGLALPFALPLRTAVAAGRRPDGLLRIRSRQEPGPPVQAPVDLLAPGSVPGWAAYVAGVVWAMRDEGHDVGGLDLVVDGEVPPGSGLSSSAALECAVALAVSDLHDLGLAPAALAGCAQRAENAFVGVPCGPIDQTVSTLATSGHATFLDTGRGTVEQVPFDPAAAGCRLLVIDTHAPHAHAGGEYATRRRECTLAAERLGVPALRSVDEAGLAAAMRALACTPVLARRVRHVVTENDRTRQAVALLRAGRVVDLGPLLTASHRSLRDDHEVSAPPLDAVVDAACRAGALGARMTGGGFGGCAIALVAEERAPDVMGAVVAACAARGFAPPTTVPSTPSAGARREGKSVQRHKDLYEDEFV